MNSDDAKRSAIKAQIDAETRKLGMLSPAEFQVALAPWAEATRNAFSLVQTLQKSWAAWVQQNAAQLEAIRKATKNGLAEVGKFYVEWDKASKRFLAALDEVERLAKMGWTIPTQLSVPEMHDFMTSLDADTAAEFLIKKLEASDPDFVRMEQRLCKDPHMIDFQTVMPQCFRAIRRGDYAIAVPNLVAMLERVIQKFNPRNLQASPDVVKTLHKKNKLAQKAKQDLFCAKIWLSLYTVVDTLWKAFTLEMPDTPVLSRPGIQHGRIEPPNTKMEIVRLLNTLETALTLHNLLEDAELFSITSKRTDGREQAFVALFTANHYLPRGKHDQTNRED